MKSEEALLAITNYWSRASRSVEIYRPVVQDRWSTATSPLYVVKYQSLSFKAQWERSCEYVVILIPIPTYLQVCWRNGSLNLPVGVGIQVVVCGDDDVSCWQYLPEGFFQLAPRLSFQDVLQVTHLAPGEGQTLHLCNHFYKVSNGLMSLTYLFPSPTSLLSQMMDWERGASIMI